MAELKYGWLATRYPRIKTLDKKGTNFLTLVMSVAVDPEKPMRKHASLLYFFYRVLPVGFQSLTQRILKYKRVTPVALE
jgi:hypothetical protein